MSPLIFQRREWLVLRGLAVVLIAAACSCSDRGGSAQPLLPDDAMSVWQAATPGQKQATAALIVERLDADGQLGPQTHAALENPAERTRMTGELVGALDKATDRDTMAYVSPSQSMVLTARGALGDLGWDE